MPATHPACGPARRPCQPAAVGAARAAGRRRGRARVATRRPGPGAPGPAVVQAAPSDRSDAAPPSGTSATAPSTGTGATHGALDDVVIFDPARDAQLDIGAKLDQGAHLSSLEARYHDWGDGNDDYYLANGNQISHQPLSDLFAPLADWLAAPDHAGHPVWLWLTTDPRSANADRFDAACKAFQNSLGQDLLKSSDLPDGKAPGDLSPNELTAVFQSHPLEVSGWSECTGDQLPEAAAANPSPVAASSGAHDHWIADLSDTIGQRPLRQVIIPGSHDTGTYGHMSSFQDQAQAQNEDVTAQLNDGARVFDLRGRYSPDSTWPSDYWSPTPSRPPTRAAWVHRHSNPTRRLTTSPSTVSGERKTGLNTIAKLPAVYRERRRPV